MRIKILLIACALVYVAFRVVRSSARNKSVQRQFTKAKKSSHLAGELADELTWPYKTHSFVGILNAEALNAVLNGKRLGEFYIADSMVLDNRILLLTERQFQDYDVHVTGSLDTVDKISYLVYSIDINNETGTIFVGGVSYSSLAEKLFHEQFAKLVMQELGFM